MWRTKGKAAVPDEECIAHGTKLLCRIDRGADGHSGAVRDEQGIMRWRYGIRKNTTGRSPGNPFNKPDFIIAEPEAKDEMIIRRASFIPSVFNVIKEGRLIGRIRMRSMFRNKYSIDIDGVNSWTFRMSLFTVRFCGDSSAGAEIWVVVGSPR